MKNYIINVNTAKKKIILDFNVNDQYIQVGLRKKNFQNTLLFPNKFLKDLLIDQREKDFLA